MTDCDNDRPMTPEQMLEKMKVLEKRQNHEWLEWVEPLREALGVTVIKLRMADEKISALEKKVKRFEDKAVASRRCGTCIHSFFRGEYQDECVCHYDECDGEGDKDVDENSCCPNWGEDV